MTLNTIQDDITPLIREWREEDRRLEAESRARGLRATYTNLQRIRVLYRDPETFCLWGIPYQMREGQSPRNLQVDHKGVRHSRWEADWVWLGGSTGWWGSLEVCEREAVQAFLAPLAAAGMVPGNAFEWCTLLENLT